MKIDLNIAYDANEFTVEEIKELKAIFFEMVKKEDRLPGVTLGYKGIMFILGYPFIDLDTGTTMYRIKQATTKSKLVKPS